MDQPNPTEDLDTDELNIFVLVYAVAGWIIYDYSRVRKKREEMILTYP